MSANEAFTDAALAVANKLRAESGALALCGPTDDTLDHVSSRTVLVEAAVYELADLETVDENNANLVAQGLQVALTEDERLTNLLLAR